MTARPPTSRTRIGRPPTSRTRIGQELGRALAFLVALQTGAQAVPSRKAVFEKDVIMATVDKDGVIFNQSSTGTPYSATGAQTRAPESEGLMGVIHSQTTSST